jgi:hypothetical protein
MAIKVWKLTMKKLKVRCFKIFVQKAVINVENLVSTIKGMEVDVCHYYAEISRRSNHNYVKMIMLMRALLLCFS